ncbi:putative endonuclease [Pedobacter terrae]|uniref:Putative endonuclease n=1 Tax=Pedobacter terrae TaxID=405671 RepID=A0A1G7QLH8_9SPHI|nr:GIY-YIG nuclease family protein [Pedobacter terrae]SDF99335.1 putative endonuclease [Pedobacter terrae]
MASVYILFSKKLNRFYIGSCFDLSKRLNGHLQGIYKDSFTSKVTDWELFLHINDLAYQQARQIELHIKKMKSRTYIENLKKYEDIQTKLIMLYR